MDDARPPSTNVYLDLLDRLFTGMIAQQEGKLLQMAREMVPDLTPEDMRNPQDFPALARNPEFNYEDGLLAGLRSAHMAVRAELRRSALTPTEQD